MNGSGQQRAMIALLVVNVALQLFDGIATYYGLAAGVGEGNPIVRWTMFHLGTGTALLAVKLQACLCLLTLYALRRCRLAPPALALCAVFYAAFSVAPWALTFARLRAL